MGRRLLLLADFSIWLVLAWVVLPFPQDTAQGRVSDLSHVVSTSWYTEGIIVKHSFLSLLDGSLEKW